MIALSGWPPPTGSPRPRHSAALTSSPRATAAPPAHPQVVTCENALVRRIRTESHGKPLNSALLTGLFVPMLVMPLFQFAKRHRSNPATPPITLIMYSIYPVRAYGLHFSWEATSTRCSLSSFPVEVIVLWGSAFRSSVLHLSQRVAKNRMNWICDYPPEEVDFSRPRKTMLRNEKLASLKKCVA